VYTRLTELGKRLAATGRQISRGGDGSLFFSAAPVSCRNYKIVTPPRPKAPMKEKGELLAAAGWHVRRYSDGSLIFAAPNITATDKKRVLVSHAINYTGLKDRFVASSI